MSKTKILFFSNLYPLPWEPTRATFSYQQTLALEKSIDVQYLIPVAWYIWFAKVLFSGRFGRCGKIVTFPFFYIPGTGRSLHAIFMLLSILVSIRPLIMFVRADNVLASWAYPEGVTAALMKKIFRFNLFIQCLGSDVNANNEDRKKLFQLKWAFALANKVITMSEALSLSVQNICPDVQVSTVYNGVNFERFKLKDHHRHESLSLLFVGTMIKTKGVFELIECASLLKEKGVDFSLAVVGQGGSLQEIKDLVGVKGLSGKVSVKGALPHEQVSKLMCEADALILPSYREGVPNVILESFATGVPVVATKVGGIPEILKHHVNGILLAGHEPNDILEGILELQKNEWNPKEIRRSIEHLTWQSNALQMQEIFELAM